jgi:microcin C transport system substrate-binding protein
MDKSDYSVFPDADVGADQSVSAEDGGAGFVGEGWDTNTDFDLIGDPHAVKGGSFTKHEIDFPGTLRTEGPDTILWNQQVAGMVYETLLGLHPTTLETMPGLATHWQVSEDGMTFSFRLNPNARFSDGEPVTSEDVVASWEFMMNPDIQAPMNRITFDKFATPVAETKYIVSVEAKDLNWRNFLYFSQSMFIYPEHVLSTLKGDAYLQDWNFKMFTGSGPYEVLEEDVEKGQSITIRRRADYWAENHRGNVGVYNFDEIRNVIVRDENLAFEMLKRGDLDFFFVNRAQMWVEELNFERVQRGLIQKRKVFNHNPNGTAGLAMNTRVEPFSDIRFRQALHHLYNRGQMIEKLFYNEYLPQNSYYAGGVYENPDNPENLYDPEKALGLLVEAGWDQRDSQGLLIKNGEPLNIELVYYSKTQETYLTVFQEDLRRVGIGLNLRLVTFATLVKLLDERRFGLLSIGYNGLLFPNPETSYHSSLADQDNTNNITGLKNARIDAILGDYDEMFDVEERIAAIREIDGILAENYLFILSWYGPYHRFVFWNKFGMPEGTVTRVGDYDDPITLWWHDPEKQQALAGAMRDESITLEAGPLEDRYWLSFEQTETQDESPQ